jgi:secreted PhoX family phosphatase
MSGIDRRTLLKSGIGAAGALALAGPFEGIVAHATPGRRATPPRLGPLADVADLADGAIRLALPAGYVYRSFGATGDVMTDGVVTSGRQDGMAAFAGPHGRIRLVRNHELQFSGAPLGDPARSYDPVTQGGTTTLEVDPATRELLGSWVSLTGTSFNCAGGPTPWGTWMSVEETVNGPDVGPDFAGAGPDFQQQHGYLYEVDPRWGPGEYPKVEPIRSVGRMPHEAAAVDPHSGYLYLTEDQFLFPAGVYRYRGPRHGRHAQRIVDGGRLEMLRVQGATEPTELGGQLEVGTQFRVDWVKIPEPDFDGGGAPNDTAIRTVSLQGFAQNAAMFARPEGLWYRRGAIFFSCTRGGATQFTGNPLNEYGNGHGQIWRLDPDRKKLTLIFQSPGPDVLDLPDNITLTKRGTIVICEDSTDGTNFVRLLDRDGNLETFAQNRFSGDEFAGAAVSPDGNTLFVNTQASAGRTFAIWAEGHRLGF